MTGWNWPQWVMAVAYALAVLLNVSKDGEIRTGKYNGGMSLVSVGVFVAILHFGGFW